MQQCTDAQPCRLRHREPNGNRRETTRLRSDTIVDLMPDSAKPRRAERIQHLACGEGAGEDARQSAKCLPSVRAAAWRRRSVLANQKRRRASPMRDTATRRRSNIDTYGYTTTEEQSENNTTGTPPTRPPATHVIPAEAGIHRPQLPKPTSADQLNTPVGATLVVALPPP